MPTHSPAEQLKKRVAVALGDLPADLVVRDVQLVNLFTDERIAAAPAPRKGRGVDTLDGVLAPESVAGTIESTIRDTLRFPHVAIEIGDGPKSIPSTGTNSERGIRFPMQYQGTWLGALIVEPREGEDGLSEPDRRLLEDLARQAGVAIHAASATVQLQVARERLVTAREEERRRLRRDLHDGLGPALAAIAAQSEAARDLVSTRPDVTAALLDDIAAQSQTATADIRRLVYNLWPPALDELGLVGALQALAQRFSTPDGLAVAITAGTIGPLPAAVEVAAYHIAQRAGQRRAARACKPVPHRPDPRGACARAGDSRRRVRHDAQSAGRCWADLNARARRGTGWPVHRVGRPAVRDDRARALASGGDTT